MEAQAICLCGVQIDEQMNLPILLPCGHRCCDAGTKSTWKSEGQVKCPQCGEATELLPRQLPVDEEKMKALKALKEDNKGGFCNDCLTSLLCCCCAMGQVYRESIEREKQKIEAAENAEHEKKQDEQIQQAKQAAQQAEQQKTDQEPRIITINMTEEQFQRQQMYEQQHVYGNQFGVYIPQQYPYLLQSYPGC